MMPKTYMVYIMLKINFDDVYGGVVDVDDDGGDLKAVHLPCREKKHPSLGDHLNETSSAKGSLNLSVGILSHSVRKGGVVFRKNTTFLTKFPQKILSINLMKHTLFFFWGGGG